MPGRRFSGPLVPGTKSVKQVNRRMPKANSKPNVKQVKKIVEKEYHKRTENKTAILYRDPIQIKPVIGTIQSENVIRCFPRVQRGTGSDNRVGDKIQPLYCEVKGYVTLDLNDQNQDYDKIMVRLIMGFDKRFPLADEALANIGDNPSDNWTHRIMDNGNQMREYDGTLRALQSPVNRKEFTVKGQRYMRLTRPRFYDAPLVGNDAFRYSGNAVKFFKMKLKCPKSISYHDEHDTTHSTTFQPVLLAGYTLLNGATPPSPDAVAPKPVSISFTTRLIYEDA